MKTHKIYKSLLAVLLLALAGVVGVAGAAVPVIELAPSSVDSVLRIPGLAPQPVVPGALQPAASFTQPAQYWQSAESFASYASDAFEVLTSAAALIPLTTDMDPGYGVLIAARPLPSLGAVLLLVLACLIYLGRRRRHGFALRPSKTLLERVDGAPARA